MAFHEGHGLRRRIEHTVPDAQGQPGLYLDGTLCTQVAQEGERKGDVPHLMGLPHGTVLKIDRAPLQGNVVEGKALGLSPLRPRLVQPVHHIVEIGLPRCELGDTQDGGIHLQRIDHRRPAQQGLHLQIHMDARHLQLRRGTVPTRHTQILQGDLQRPGQELQAPHGHLAPQQVAQCLLRTGMNQRRHRQPERQPNQQQRPGGHLEPAPPGIPLGRRQQTDKWQGQGTLHGVRWHGKTMARLEQTLALPRQPVETRKPGGAAPCATHPGLTADTTVFAIGLRYGGMWSVPRGARDCPQGVALEARHSVCAGTACTGSGLCFVRRCLHRRGKHTLSKNAPQHKSDRQSRNAHRLKLDAALHPIQHTSTCIGPAHRRNRSKSVIFDSFLRIFMS